MISVFASLFAYTAWFWLLSSQRHMDPSAVLYGVSIWIGAYVPWRTLYALRARGWAALKETVVGELLSLVPVIALIPKILPVTHGSVQTIVLAAGVLLPSVVYGASLATFAFRLCRNDRAQSGCLIALQAAGAFSLMYSVCYDPSLIAISHLFGAFVPVGYGATHSAGSALLTWRIATVATAGVALGGAKALAEPWDRSVLKLPVCAVVFLPIFLEPWALSVWGCRMGKQALAETMQQVSDDGNICIYAAPNVRSHEANSAAEGMQRRFKSVAQTLDVKRGRQVTVFIYADAAELRTTVASEVSFSKPMGRLMHLTLADADSAVADHESVHLLATAFGGLFGVSTRFGVLIQTGLVEGLAEALAKDDRGTGLTLQQRVKALSQRGIDTHFAPRLYAYKFYQKPLQQSYAVSGAFVAWLIDHYGMPSVRCVYQSGDFLTCFGTSLTTLDGRWQDEVQTIILTPEQQRRASLLFE